MISINMIAQLQGAKFTIECYCETRIVPLGQDIFQCELVN